MRGSSACTSALLRPPLYPRGDGPAYRMRCLLNAVALVLWPRALLIYSSIGLWGIAAMTSTSLTEIVPPHPLQEIELQEPHDGAFINQELAPTDRGLAAWKLLGTAFVFESLLWGKYYIVRVLATIRS